METKLMANPIPSNDLASTAGVRGADNSRKSADSTEKHSSPDYMPLELEFKLSEEEINDLKEKYPDKAEFELVKAFKYRRRVLEFGTEMLNIMIKYWKNKIKNEAY